MWDLGTFLAFATQVAECLKSRPRPAKTGQQRTFAGGPEMFRSGVPGDETQKSNSVGTLVGLSRLIGGRRRFWLGLLDGREAGGCRHHFFSYSGDRSVLALR